MKLFLYSLIILSFVACFHTVQGQTITTVAGNGFFSYSGNGGQATDAQLMYPNDITIDAGGNMLIADRYNNCIRKVSTSGIITTIAGTTAPGYTADGVAATSSGLNYPTCVITDGSGNIYIADRDNNRIRKIAPSGIISTFAGIGIASYFGDNGDATAAILNGPTSLAIDGAGNMYFADQQNHVVRKINVSGKISRFAGSASQGYSGDGLQATAGQLAFPSGVAVDAGGNVYIADYYNSRIRKVNTSGIISTFAGKSTAGYSGDGGAASAAELYHPYSVRTDAGGDIYISDCGNNCIRKVNAAGIISTIAGTGDSGFDGDGGPATDAVLFSPKSIAKDAAGNIYVTDSGNNRIRKINTSGIISTYAGGVANGQPATAVSVNPYNSVVDASGNIYMADADNNRICKISTAGIITTVAGNLATGYSGDGGDATAASLAYPTGVAFDKAGNLYIVDKGNNMIRKVSPAGIISTFAGTGGNAYTGDGGPATDADLSQPNGITVDAAGNVLIADQTHNSVRKVNTSGIISTIAGTGVFGYSGDGGPATNAVLTHPSGVSVDLNGNMYVTDFLNNVIRRVDTAGIITNTAGTGMTGYSGDGGPATSAKLLPDGLFVDSSGNIYVADRTHRCRIINALGIISTIAGTGAATFTGDGGPASAATLHSPTGVTLDANGNIYISDYDNYRIRKIQSIQLPAINVPAPVCIGASARLSNATAGGTWTSAAPTVATIGSLSGIITGVSAGTAKIIYDVAGTTVATTVTVNPLPAAGAISGSAAVCAGSAITLTDSTAGGVWGRSNASATVSGGVVTGVSAGTNTISYSVTNICGTAVSTATVTINPLPSAGSIAGAASVCAGSSITLTDAISGGTWSSSNATSSVAGGTVTGVSAGTNTISYSVTNLCGTATATKIITTNPLPDAGIITGAGSVCTGSSITLTNSTGSGVWSSSNVSVSLSGGVVTGITAGTSTISYTVTTVCGTATALKTISVNPLPLADTIRGLTSVCIASTIALTDNAAGGVWGRSNTNAFVAGGIVSGLSAGVDTISYTVINACGTARALTTITVNPLAAVSLITGPSAVCEASSITLTDAAAGGVWSSSSAAATVSGGIVNGVSAGTAVISYVVTTTCGSASAIANIIVNPLPSAGVINGPTAVCEGASITLTDIIAAGTWTSGNANATVSGGVITGISAGNDTIRYSVTNSCGTGITDLVIRINALPVITGSSGICEGATVTLSNNTPGGAWSSSNTLQATIAAASGMVSGVTAGTTTITYTAGTGCAASEILTVNPNPSAITGRDSVCVNGTTGLSDQTPGGTWVTANHSLAAVDGITGIVTGVAEGLVSLSYVLPTGCNANELVRVDPLPDINEVTGSDKVCVGSVITLSDAVNGGVWSSVHSFVSISDTGRVTGISAGADTIIYTVKNVCGTATALWPLTVSQCGSSNTSVVLKVSPNPNEGSFTLLLSSGTNQPATIIITNVPGQKVLTLHVMTNTTIPITLSSLQCSGIYLITAIVDGSKYETKVVVIR